MLAIAATACVRAASLSSWRTTIDATTARRLGSARQIARASSIPACSGHSSACLQGPTDLESQKCGTHKRWRQHLPDQLVCELFEIVQRSKCQDNKEVLDQT
jgi:hypothetical protein